MNTTYTSTEIKATARHKLLGKYGVAVAIYFLFMAIRFAEYVITSSLGNGGMVAELLLSVAILLLMGGLKSFFLNISLGRDYNVTDLFHLFSPRAGLVKAYVYFASNLFRMIYQTLPLLPGLVLLYLYGVTGTLLYLFIGCGLLVPGIPIMLFLAMTYAQTDYVVLEAIRNERGVYIMVNGDHLTPLGAMRVSAELMTGHRLEFLYLMVSFAGWFVLGICSCGLAFFWIMPYLLTTYSEYYQYLIAARQRRQMGEPGSAGNENTEIGSEENREQTGQDPE